VPDVVLEESLPEPPQPPIEKTPKFTPPYNKLFMQVLEDLIKLMKKQRDFVHQLAYKRALETVRGFTEDINDVSQLKGKNISDQ